MRDCGGYIIAVWLFGSITKWAVLVIKLLNEVSQQSRVNTQQQRFTSMITEFNVI